MTHGSPGRVDPPEDPPRRNAPNVQRVGGKDEFHRASAERPVFVSQLKEHIPFYALRFSVKPGITGWAQVKYPYGSTVADALEKLQYDLYYVKNFSVFLDLIILVIRSVSFSSAVVRGKGPAVERTTASCI